MAANSLLAENLKAAREAAGLSQRDVAKELNVHVMSISNWERGVYTPDDRRLDQLAKLYGSSPALLRYGLTRADNDAIAEAEFKAPTPADHEFAARLRAARQRSGHSIAAISRLLRISPSQLEAYEAPTAVPRYEELAVLAALYKTSVSWLMLGAEEADPPEDNQSFWIFLHGFLHALAEAEVPIHLIESVRDVLTDGARNYLAAVGKRVKPNDPGDNTLAAIYLGQGLLNGLVEGGHVRPNHLERILGFIQSAIRAHTEEKGPKTEAMLAALTHSSAVEMLERAKERFDEVHRRTSAQATEPVDPARARVIAESLPELLVPLLFGGAPPDRREKDLAVFRKVIDREVALLRTHGGLADYTRDLVEPAMALMRASETQDETARKRAVEALLAPLKRTANGKKADEAIARYDRPYLTGEGPKRSSSLKKKTGHSAVSAKRRKA